MCCWLLAYRPYRLCSHLLLPRQEDAEAGIAFVQTSAKLVTRESSSLVVSADGTVQSSGVSEPASPSSRTSFAVTADGRMHMEM